MSSSPDAFREKAADCERQTEEIKDPSIKQTLLNLAKQWRDLARQVEDLDRIRDESVGVGKGR